MAGQNNFLVWNPSAANQENDSAFSGDSQRINGAADPSEFASSLANKLFYQVSLWVAAEALMLSGKGYSPVDGTSPFTAAATPAPGTPEANLAGVLANILTNADMPSIITNVFAGSAFSMAANGYVKLPPVLGSLIVQWGRSGAFPTGSNVSTVTISFAASGGVLFPNSAFVAVTNADNLASSGFHGLSLSVTALSTSGMTISADTCGGSGNPIQNTVHAYWVAIGY